MSVSEEIEKVLEMARELRCICGVPPDSPISRRKSSKQVPRMDKENGARLSLIKGLISEIDFEDRPLSKMV